MAFVSADAYPWSVDHKRIRGTLPGTSHEGTIVAAGPTCGVLGLIDGTDGALGSVRLQQEPGRFFDH